MDAVGVLLGEKTEGDWNAARALIKDVKAFMDKLLNYRKDNIPETTLIKLRKYLAIKDFQPETVKKVSAAAQLLCLWCISINKYAIVAKNIEPKKKKAKEMQAKLDEANA
mmetsp:Transcript_28798/g.26017  ORF Transcript_28798/g.26017 Transcript_28798/m.26017 type:complete len:110 (-) Transcript_28798:2309-2638(-)